MDGPLAGATVFACLFSSALAGVAAHARLPGRLQPLTSTAVARGGVVALAGLAAALMLVMTLGQKAGFDTASRDVQQLSTRLVQLDSSLRATGADGVAARGFLFRYTVNTMQALWPDGGHKLHQSGPRATEALRRLQAAVDLLPRDNPGALARAEAAQRALMEVTQACRALWARANGGMSPYLTGLVLLGLMLTFAGLGLWAQPDGVRRTTSGTMAALFLGAVVLGGGMFLLREYNDPFEGVIVVSHEPLQNALFTISE